MRVKTALMAGAALFTAGLFSLGSPAEAATARSRAEADRQTQEEIRQLRAMVEALTARLDAQDRARSEAQGQLAAAQADAAAARAQASAAQAEATRVAATSQALQAKVDETPAQITAALAKVPRTAAWADTTSITGRMYFNLSNIGQESNGGKVAPSGTGFDIKRFYVGVDHRFNSTYSANITTDLQYSSVLGSTHLFVKKAYLQAAYSDALTVRLGAADMPWVPFAEEVYGYRYIEQTLTDRTRFGTSAEWGVHAAGKLGPKVSYAVAVVNGAGFRAPLRSQTMDVEGRISAKLGDVTLGVGGYTGKLGRNTQGATNVFHTANRFNAIAGYAKGPVRVGVEYFRASNWANVTTVATDKSEGWSMFGAYQIAPKFTAFARYDWVKPRDTTAPAMDENYFNIGLQYEPVRIVDLSLVYKRDRVDNGTLNTTNGVIGGTVNGTYDEVGVFGQLRW